MSAGSFIVENVEAEITGSERLLPKNEARGNPNALDTKSNIAISMPHKVPRKGLGWMPAAQSEA